MIYHTAFKQKAFGKIECRVGLLCLIIGYIIAFSLQYHGYKWELSRFLMPGFFIGQIFLAYVYCYYLNNTISIHKKSKNKTSLTKVILVLSLIFIINSGSILSFQLPHINKNAITKWVMYNLEL